MRPPALNAVIDLRRLSKQPSSSPAKIHGPDQLLHHRHIMFRRDQGLRRLRQNVRLRQGTGARAVRACLPRLIRV